MKRPRILRDVLTNLVIRPATVRYPDEPVPVPEGFRGRIAIRDEVCVGCSVCAVVCPTGCIDMVPSEREVETRGGRKMLRKKKPEVHLFACIRCGLCEEFCPTDPKAIYLTKAFAGTGTDTGAIVR